MRGGVLWAEVDSVVADFLFVRLAPFFRRDVDLLVVGVWVYGMAEA